MSKKWSLINHKKYTYIYKSVCCGQPATKPAVKRSPEDIKENKFSECSLGHWRCTQCEKPCKVTREKNNKETEKTNGTDAGVQ